MAEQTSVERVHRRSYSEVNEARWRHPKWDCWKKPPKAIPPGRRSDPVEPNDWNTGRTRQLCAMTEDELRAYIESVIPTFVHSLAVRMQ